MSAGSELPSGAPAVWSRYVAVGDSFTEGMSDPDPEHDDVYLGWADRLAASLADIAHTAGQSFEYANLAVRGRLVADVVGAQLDEALAMAPDLVSIVGGGNDLLRKGADPGAVAARLEEAVVRARATGADVLLATPVDPREAGLLRALRPRHAVHAANVFTIAQRHGCRVLNQWGLVALQDWRMWAPDRIHMSTEGHRRVALAALDALGYPTDVDAWSTPLPPADRGTRRAELREHAEWARAHVAPWVQRRLQGRSSGDGRDAKRPALQPVSPPSARPPMP